MSRLIRSATPGFAIPSVGLGTHLSAPGEVGSAVRSAILDHGYRHIDCARGYDNEREVGAALEGIFTATDNSISRDDVFITSKLWSTFHEPELVEAALKKTLADLRLDRLDLYLVHWPTGFESGGEMFPRNADNSIRYSEVDYLDTWRAMELVQEAGLTRHIGCSNFNHDQLGRVLTECRVRPRVNQVECNPYFTQLPLLDFCVANDVHLSAYSPLGAPCQPFRNADMPNLLDDTSITAIGTKHGKTAAQVALRYNIQRGVSVLPKSVKPLRIRENIAVFDFELSPSEMRQLDALNRGLRIVDPPILRAHKYYPFLIDY